MNYLLVGIGGMIGSILRYVISNYVSLLQGGNKFPLHTFIVNIFGCLVVGIMSGLLMRSADSNIRLFFVVGFLGGFTTFSAFGLETFNLINSGEIFTAALYTILSVLLGVVVVFIGFKMSSIF